jgi:hypothetical protein
LRDQGSGKSAESPKPQTQGNVCFSLAKMPTQLRLGVYRGYFKGQLKLHNSGGFQEDELFLYLKIKEPLKITAFFIAVFNRLKMFSYLHNSIFLAVLLRLVASPYSFSGPPNWNEFH